jgi:alcohol dehydrogenase
MSWDVRLGEPRLVFGAGAIERLGELAAELGARDALIVTDPGVRAAGHVEPAEASLRAAGITPRVYDGVVSSPAERDVERARRFAAERPVDCLIGLGGGSAMDCAKGVNLLLTHGGRMRDYHGRDRAARPLLPSIGVPTTAGSGSDAQSYALILHDDSGLKLACGNRGLRFRTVILDPALARTAPRQVAATAGIDAVSHAVESYVTRGRNPLSSLHAREAWRLLDSSFETVLATPGDVEAWGRMLLGSYLAGTAIELSMLGAAHACANPLTARFAVTHGIAIGLMLPPVMRFNDLAVSGLYDELARASSPAAAGGTLVDRVTRLRAAAGLPERLRDHDIPRERLPELAADAAAQWTASHNPRPVAARELREIYEAAY